MKNWLENFRRDPMDFFGWFIPTAFMALLGALALLSVFLAE